MGARRPGVRVEMNANGVCSQRLPGKRERFGEKMVFEKENGDTATRDLLVCKLGSVLIGRYYPTQNIAYTCLKYSIYPKPYTSIFINFF